MNDKIPVPEVAEEWDAKKEEFAKLPAEYEALTEKVKQERLQLQLQHLNEMAAFWQKVVCFMLLNQEEGTMLWEPEELLTMQKHELFQTGAIIVRQSPGIGFQVQIVSAEDAKQAAQEGGNVV